MAISQGHSKDLASLLLGIALLWQFVSINGLSIAATIPSFDPASLVRFPLRLWPLFCVAFAPRPDDAQHHCGLPGFGWPPR